jgi:hypothetical protein
MRKAQQSIHRYRRGTSRGFAVTAPAAKQLRGHNVLITQLRYSGTAKRHPEAGKQASNLWMAGAAVQGAPE